MMTRPFQRITGLVAPVFTPMRPDGKIDLDTIEPYADLLQRYSLNGIFICGTSGECPSLTVSERIQIAEKWSQVIDEDMMVMVHVGHDCLESARTLAQHAVQIGADAISAFAPSYFVPNSVGTLIDYCAEIAAAASNLPFYYYHIPGKTHAFLPMPDFLRQAGQSIPSLCGLKFTHSDLYEAGRAMQERDGYYDVLLGKDELLLPALAIGIKGAIGTLYNVCAPLYASIIRAVEMAEWQRARELHTLSSHLTALFLQYGGTVGVAKAMMSFRGIDCGPVRLPVSVLNADQAADLETKLWQAGLESYWMQAGESAIRTET